jgi:hypothetical protein
MIQFDSVGFASQAAPAPVHAVDKLRRAALRKRTPSIAVWNMPLILGDDKKVSTGTRRM